MAELRRLNLSMTGGTVNAWRRVASGLGYVTERGSLKGMGSVSALLTAIAAGDVDGTDLVEAFRSGMVEDVPDGQMGLPGAADPWTEADRGTFTSES